MKHLPALIIALATLNVWGALPPDSNLENRPPPINKIGGLNGIYQIPTNSAVVPDAVIVNGDVEGNIGGVSIAIYKDEPVALEFLNTGEVLMTLRLPDEEVGHVPEQLILSQEEFQLLNLRMISMGDVQTLKSDYTGYFATEVASRNGQAKARRHTVRQEQSRGYGGRRDRTGRIAGGGGNCVSVVKSLTGFSGTAGNGVGMASALQNHGYRPLAFSSRRRGTVCSWSGGFHGKGHVGWFDGHCFQPTYGGNCGQPGSRFRLVKCVARA